MSLLTTISRGKKKKPRRTMLHATKGLGKSTFASMAEDPIFIQTEDGLNDIDTSSFPLCKTYQDVLGQIATLYTEPHSFKTAVIDTLDWLEQLILAEVCRERNVKSIEDIGFGKGYIFALTHWRTVLDGLQALRDERGMAIILLAHTSIEKFQDPQTDGYDRYVPCLHKHASAVIQEWCDEVLFGQYKVFVKSDDQGFGKKQTKGISTGERIIKTEERPSHVAKNRLNLPFEIPLNYHEYARYFTNATEEGAQ